MRAPRLSATLRATSRSPRRTSTSVTASPSVGRAEIACRCAWLLVLRDIDEIGFGQPRRQFQHRTRRPQYRRHWQACAAPSPAHCAPARDGSTVRRAPWSRSPRSAARRRRRTGRRVRRCSWLAPSRKSAVMRCSVSARFSREPCWITSSSSGNQREGSTHFTEISNQQPVDRKYRRLIRLVSDYRSLKEAD